MPPIYELSSPLFYHTQQDRAEKIQNVGGKIIDISVDNGEAGMYFALVLAFYVVVVGILLGTNFTKTGCVKDQSPEGRKLVVDFYEGDKVASSLVSDEEEDDRDNVVPL